MLLEFLPVLQNLPRRVTPRGPRQTRARVTAGPAKVKSLARRSVARPAEQRPHGEELVERRLPVVDVPARERVSLLEVERRDHLPVEDEAGKTRSIFGQGLDHRIAQSVALTAPTPALELERGKLHADGHHLLSGGRKRGIAEGGNCGVEDRLGRELAVPRGVEGALEVVDL